VSSFESVTEKRGRVSSTHQRVMKRKGVEKKIWQGQGRATPTPRLAVPGMGLTMILARAGLESARH